MTRENIIQKIKDKFTGDIIDFLDKSNARFYLEIKPESIKNVTRYIFKELGARFNIASGVDTRYHMEILYHFTFEEINLVISVRVKLDKVDPEIDSISGICEGANWVEREIYELLGVNFRGHPDLRRLLLPDEWPEGVYPLKRDYKEWDNGAIRDRGV